MGEPLPALQLGQGVPDMGVRFLTCDQFVHVLWSACILTKEVPAEIQSLLPLVGVEHIGYQFAGVLGHLQVLVQDAEYTPMRDAHGV